MVHLLHDLGQEGFEPPCASVSPPPPSKGRGGLGRGLDEVMQASHWPGTPRAEIRTPG